MLARQILVCDRRAHRWLAPRVHQLHRKVSSPTQPILLQLAECELLGHGFASWNDNVHAVGKGERHLHFEAWHGTDGLHQLERVWGKTKSYSAIQMHHSSRSGLALAKRLRPIQKLHRLSHRRAQSAPLWSPDLRMVNYRFGRNLMGHAPWKLIQKTSGHRWKRTSKNLNVAKLHLNNVILCLKQQIWRNKREINQVFSKTHPPNIYFIPIVSLFESKSQLISLK